MQHYPPNRVCINTVESRRRWAQLRRVLLVTMLPRWRSGRVRCTPDDFMLMLINPQGDVYFKNVVTRNYLIVTASGAIRVPTGAPFFLGVFERADA